MEMKGYEQMENMEEERHAPSYEIVTEADDTVYAQLEGEEDITRRGENTKHYDLGEHRYQAIVYPEPVHYRTPEDEIWKEIDNNLEEAVAEDNRLVLHNRAGALMVELPRTTDAGALIRLTRNGYTLSWKLSEQCEGISASVRNGAELNRERLLSMAKASPALAHKPMESIPDDELKRLETAEARRSDTTGKTSEVQYDNILPGVTARYTLSGNKVKEDIIAGNKEALERIAVELPNGYAYTVDETERVLVSDKVNGEKRFVFQSPVVYDAEGKYTECCVELAERGEYTRMRYILPDEYLETATYPVTIDPIVEGVGTDEPDMVEAISLDIANPNSVNISIGSKKGYLTIGSNGAKRYATVMRFKTLADIKSSDTVISAKLKIRKRANASAANKYVGAYEVLSDWTTSATGANFMGDEKVSSTPLDYAVVSPDFLSFDLTNLYRKWYQADNNGQGQNYGILLKCMSSKSKYFELRSAEYNKKSARPSFTVNYISHAGLTGWGKYESQSAGRAGTMHVDLFNGNVVYEHADTSMSGSRMPVSVSHTYNSCQSTMNELRCGYGWRHSGLQYIYKKKIGSKKYFVWVDGSGTEHWFEEKGKGRESKDLEGMQLKLKLLGESKSLKRPERIEIEDKSHTVMTFQRQPGKDYGGTWEKYWLIYVEGSTKEKNTVTYGYEVPAGKASDADSEDMRALEGKILKIEESAGRSTRFTYYGSTGLLSKIETPDNEVGVSRSVIFHYDADKRLEGIHYSEMGGSESTKHTEFKYYTPSTNLLRSAKNVEDGTVVTATYEQVRLGIITAGTNTDMDDVEEEEGAEKGSGVVEGETKYNLCRAVGLETTYKGIAGEAGTVYGAKEGFEYKNCATKVTIVEEATGGATAGKTLTYQFNDKGNVTGVQDELGYAQFAKYDNENAVTGVSKLQKAVVNVLRNVHLTSVSPEATTWSERSEAWQPVNGNSANKITIDGTASGQCMGIRSMKLTRAKGTGGELYYRQRVRLEPNKTYTFSAYVQTEGKGTGAYLRIGTNAQDYTQCEKSFAIKGKTDDGVDMGLPTDGWERQYAVYKTPSGTGEMHVYADLVHGGDRGTVRYACAQLEEGEVANSVNLLTNGDFRYTRTTEEEHIYPRDWTAGKDVPKRNYVYERTGDSTFPSALSGKYLRMEDKAAKKSREAYFYQAVNIAGKKGDVFFVGGWGNAKGMPMTDEKARGARGFRLKASFLCKGKWVDGESGKHAFSSEWIGWQATGGAVGAPKDYTQVRVYVTYKGNPNPGRFTNIFLHREQFGQSYAYSKENKNMVDIGTLSGESVGMDYDKYHNLTQYRKAGRPKDSKYKYRMGYGSKEEAKRHLLKEMSTPEGVRKEYGYDDYGNRIWEKGITKTKDQYIRTETEYESTRNYAVKKRDARKNEMTLEVNARTGEVGSVTDAAGTKLEYEYDARRRLKRAKVTVGTQAYQNDYTYNKGRLETVSHNTGGNDVKYTFEYDDQGAQTKVSVGPSGSLQMLSKNTYSTDRSHRLTETEYGNGGKVKNEYDAYNRLTGVKYDTATEAEYQYAYGANGQVARVTDRVLKRTQDTQYDLAQRPKRTTTRSTEGNKNLVYEATLKYDQYNHLDTFKEEVSLSGTSTETYKTEYSYDKDDRTTEIEYDEETRTAGYSYDALGRMSKVEVKNGSTHTVKYDYVGGGYGKGSTTSLVEKITQPHIPYEYSYDKVRNIVTEKRGEGSGAKTTGYAYDKLGQLTRVNDPNDTAAGSGGTTWLYEYDQGGNIQTKRQYAYTTGTINTTSNPGTVTGYAYTNANWKDQMMSYGGKTVGYDAIGNAKTYDGWTYTWTRGRQLSKVAKTGLTAEYAYDASGLRVQKKVTEGTTVTTTGYRLHGKLLMHLTESKVVNNGTPVVQQLHFYYDAQSRPMMVKYGEAYYTYLHNLQGDIVGIIDATGAKVVEYKYDAWGRAITPTGSLAGTLGKVNPFRYRGYVYDEETLLYYLRSRYYNPLWARFVSADVFVGKIGKLFAHNLFAYGANRPTINVDSSGYMTHEGGGINGSQESINDLRDKLLKVITDQRWKQRYVRREELRKKYHIPDSAIAKPPRLGEREVTTIENAANAVASSIIFGGLSSPLGGIGTLCGLGISIMDARAQTPNVGEYKSITYEFTYEYQGLPDPLSPEGYRSTYTKTWTITDCFDTEAKNNFTEMDIIDTGI